MKKHRFMTVSTILNQSFNLYFKNFVKLTLPAACLYLPLGLFMGLSFSRIDWMDMAQTGGTHWAFLLSVWGVSLLSVLLMIPITIYLIRLASNLYSERQEERGVLIRMALRRFFPLCGMGILLGLGIYLGMILLIVPGVILMLSWLLAPIVLVIEDGKVFASIKRSRALTKGFRWKLLGLYILVSMIISTVTYLAMLLLAFVFAALFFLQGEGLQVEEIMSNAMALYGVFAYFVSVLTMPFYSVVGVVLYYNIRKEKEGFETLDMASSFLEETKDRFERPEESDR